NELDVFHLGFPFMEIFYSFGIGFSFRFEEKGIFPKRKWSFLERIELVRPRNFATASKVFTLQTREESYGVRPSSFEFFFQSLFLVIFFIFFALNKEKNKHR